MNKTNINLHNVAHGLDIWNLPPLGDNRAALPPVDDKQADVIVGLPCGEDGDRPAATPNLPTWCRSDCQELEAIDLPLEGLTWGCVQQCYDFEEWKRLDWMQQCPRIVNEQNHAGMLKLSSKIKGQLPVGDPVKQRLRG